MGLKMNDIHTPTTNGASSRSNGSATNDSQKSLIELMNDRDKLESELQALGEVLVSVLMNNHMSTSPIFADL